MSHEPPSLLEAVSELAALAGARALEHFRRGVAVEWKPDGSPVTRADREAEAVARAWILERFPSDGVLGEELGETNAGAPRRWLVDPVDGTKSFVRGVPLWGTLVAVMESGAVLASAAAFPAAGERIAAARGAGAWWNGSRTRVSMVGRVEAALVLATGFELDGRPERRMRWDRLAARAAAARTWGDAFGYFLVATGRAEAMVDGRLNAWDSAPMSLIVEEAGGVFTDWRGVRTPVGADAIATNSALAADVRDALRDP